MKYQVQYPTKNKKLTWDQKSILNAINFAYLNWKRDRPHLHYVKWEIDYRMQQLKSKGNLPAAQVLCCIEQDTNGEDVAMEVKLKEVVIARFN